MAAGQITMLPVFVAAGLFLAAVFLLLRARHQRRRGELPKGQLIYIDDVARDCPVLLSHRYGLKGKPDAVVRATSGELIPVERKRTRAPRHRPYDGDLNLGHGLLHSGRRGIRSRSAIHARLSTPTAGLMSHTRRSSSNGRWKPAVA